MPLQANRLILLLLGYFICPSLELACIQCTSPIERVAQNWDHSCLDGTLTPVLCEQSTNETKKPYLNCISALYRISLNGNGGLHIHRGCSMIQAVRHECDPPVTSIDLDSTLDFFCSRTCENNGCNQHSVVQISSNMNRYFSKNDMLLKIVMIILVHFSVLFSFFLMK
ncbi:hypothetical protein I4U23_025426 [Adineta vaga]|nr:hypothetical protein I4U23_025426 [Adineta vaga]